MASLFVKYKSATIDTLCLMALQGLNYLLPLCVWPYLMVVLGVEQFGVIGFASALMQFLIIVVDYGFNITATNSMNVTFDIAQANKDKYFVFEQGVSSNIWIINHNLNKKASVTVVDEYDRVVTPAVEYVNDNKIILRFNFAFKGKAYLN